MQIQVLKRHLGLQGKVAQFTLLHQEHCTFGFLRLAYRWRLIEANYALSYDYLHRWTGLW